MGSYIFCHSGYGLHYDIGVCKTLKMKEGNIYYGHGTGAFIACAIRLNIDMDYIHNIIIDVHKDAFYELLFSIIEEHCKLNSDAYIRCCNKVHIGILLYVNSYVFISTFNNNDELLQTLKCSLYVDTDSRVHYKTNTPVLSGHHLCLYNAKYPETVIVNCISENNGDIHSHIPIISRTPPDEHCALIYSLKGIYDTKDWLKNGCPANKNKKHIFTSSLIKLYMKWMLVYARWMNKIYSFEIKTSFAILALLYFLKNKNRHIHI